MCLECVLFGLSSVYLCVFFGAVWGVLHVVVGACCGIYGVGVCAWMRSCMAESPLGFRVGISG